MGSKFFKILWKGILGISVLALQTHAYEVVEVNNGGSITGTVSFAGTPPSPQKIKIDKELAICGAHEKTTENLIISKENKGIKNGVVSITNIQKGKAMVLLQGNPQLDQKGCWFNPHIQIIPAGATLEILNPDGILHNIHTLSSKNPPINKAQPKFKKTLPLTFNIPEIFPVKCDAHSWMGAWLVVADHPYYSITDASGKFTLTDVPAGTYTLEYWHETLEIQTKEVTVTQGAETKADMTLKPKIEEKKEETGKGE